MDLELERELCGVTSSSFSPSANMEDEDGTCLLDVLCDPQALNNFLHGTNELQNEDLLITCSSGEPPSLFTDPPSPMSLLADDITTSQDTPPAECVDLSFLEEALLGGSPEGGGERRGAREEEQEEVPPCDILQQSLQEADITEHTMALEAGLVQPGPGEGHTLSLYTPGPPLLPPPAAVPFLSKAFPHPYPGPPHPYPGPPTLPPMHRDTQAAVEPPQPSLLAVGPGCPSLKPAAPQMMGLLPGNIFPAPPPETSFSLTPAQASNTSFSLIHKAVPSLTGLKGPPLLASTLRAAAAPGIFLQRGPLPIQPKLPINIQPRLVQISPKPPGPGGPSQKPSPGLTFLPGTPSSNILLSPPPPGSKPPPQPQPAQHLTSRHLTAPHLTAPHLTAPHLTKPQPLSLQLVNQGGGSFLIQPQGLFHGQNQFLLPGQSPVTLSQLPGQSPVTLSQPGGAARPLFTSGHQGATVQSVQGMTPSIGHHLVDGSQILTAVPHHRQLNFSPHTVFSTTPTGQLSLRQGTLLSGPLQLQSGSPALFQMPAQLAGAYSPQGPQGQGGPGQHATLLHSPALGNHITLMHSGMQLTSTHPDSHMTSISILNSTPPAVVQGLPFTPQTSRPLGGTTEGQISVQQASVVLLPDRAGHKERREEATSPHLPQSTRHLLQQHASLQPSTASLQSPSPPVVALLQTPLEAPQALDPPGMLPKHLLDPVGSLPKHLLDPVGSLPKHLLDPVGSLPKHLLDPVGSLPKPLLDPVGSLPKHLLYPVGSLPKHLLYPVGSLPKHLLDPVGTSHKHRLPQTETGTKPGVEEEVHSPITHIQTQAFIHHLQQQAPPHPSPPPEDLAGTVVVLVEDNTVSAVASEMEEAPPPIPPHPSPPPEDLAGTVSAVSSEMEEAPPPIQPAVLGQAGAQSVMPLSRCVLVAYTVPLLPETEETTLPGHSPTLLCQSPTLLCQSPTLLCQSPPEQGLGTTPPAGQGLGTTPPAGQGLGTTPPNGQGLGTTPPNGQGLGTTPPARQGLGTTPPNGQGLGTTPPARQGLGTTPPNGQGLVSTPPAGQGLGTTPTPGQTLGSTPPRDSFSSPPSGATSLGLAGPGSGSAGSAVPQTQTAVFRSPSPLPVSASHQLQSAMFRSPSPLPVSPSPLPVSRSPLAVGPYPQLQTAVFSNPSPSPLPVCVPQQQCDTLLVSPSSSGEVDQANQHHAVQQHTKQSKPPAALAMDVKGKAFTLDVHPPSPRPQGHQGPPVQGPNTVQGPHTVQGPQANREQNQWLRAVQTAQQSKTKVAGPVAREVEQRLTEATCRHRLQQKLCQNQGPVQIPYVCSPFSSLGEAVTHLLPYHACAGHLPSQDDFNLVDEQFVTVSRFLLKRSKDMLNKYRQLLLGETLQVIPSAEMVMLDRLFLQSERFSLGEDRRRARRDPESFLMALHASESSSSSRVGLGQSGSPPSPPAWTRLSDRPPGLRTYHSSSRGGLKLTIKHKAGSRMVVHNSACDTMQSTAPSGHKRYYTGQLTNGSGDLTEQNLQGSSHRTSCHPISEEMSNGALPSKAVEDVPHGDSRESVAQIQTAVLGSQYVSSPNSITMPSLDPQTACLELPPQDPGEVSAPKLKRFRPTLPDLPSQADRHSYRPQPRPQTSYRPQPLPQTSDRLQPLPQTSNRAEPLPQISYRPQPRPQTSDRPQPLPQTSNRAEPLPQTSYRPQPLPQISYRPQPRPQTSDRLQPLPQTSNRAEPLPQTSNRAEPLPQTSDRPQTLPQTSYRPQPRPQTSDRLQPLPQTSDRLQPLPRPATGPSPFPRPATGPSPFPRPATGPSPFPRPATGPSPFPRPATGPRPFPRPATDPSPFPRPATDPSPFPRPATGPSPFPRPATGPRLVPAPHPPLPEDNTLSEHLQSAIDSILELQRLQGPTAASQPWLQGACPAAGPASLLDQAITSILQGNL
ncbi:hypothetical protein J4Q44_G00254800 [Coregonus suidteri]|uniref:GLTSCR protein conserved domain-containing protein n=1 Tax=Coregonus suidteri TaxID=861788 RepID=A0AAN8QGH3_9TELE